MREKKTLKVGSLASAVPTIQTYWHSSNTAQADQVAATSTLQYSYYCPTCEQVTLRRAKDIAHRPSACQVCSGKVVVPGVNDALSAQPLLATLWDYSKNTALPEDYSRQSGKKTWLKCSNCRQSTLRKICDAVRTPTACVVCSGRGVIPGHNDLASQHPRLIDEWSSKNSTDPATLPASGGRHFAWWTCSTCRNEWRTSIGWRVKGNGCPYCANQKVKEGFNDLTTTRPALLTYWDYSKNALLPTEITGGSNTPVHWTCEKGHSWKGTPASRWNAKENRPHACNSCSRSARTSQGEKEVYDFIKSLAPDAVQTDSTIFPGIEVDIHIPSLSIAVEYNGDYWHSTHLMKEKYGIDAKKFHQERKARLATVGVTLYYLWETDWKNHRTKIEKILTSLITHGHSHPLLLKLENDTP